MKHSAASDVAIADLAATWVARADRGLSAAEARELAAWRAADPRHATEFDRLQREWAGLELARADPGLVRLAGELEAATRPAPTRRTRRTGRWLGGSLAAAAALALTWFAWRPEASAPAASGSQPYQILPRSVRTLDLADGSKVELRGDSEVAVEFLPGERRLRLVRGEAHFTVARDPARPFIVSAASVAVSAIGTAFNVRLDSALVDVLVTHGRVQVATAAPTRAPAPSAGPPAPAATLLDAGERLTVPLLAVAAAGAAEVTPVRPAEMNQLLAWQRTRLVFNRTALGEAVEAFNRHGSRRLELGDPALRDRLLGGTFRADNVEAFVRLLEQSDGLRAEHHPDGRIVLWPAR
jgi:transmembrane sensor